MTKQFTHLTDTQWQAISSFFNLGRKRKHNLRQIVDALLYILRTGCQWRNLPAEWPHWQAVYYYFDRWKTDGTLEQVNQQLNKEDRVRQGRQAEPSVLSIDSQSIKLSPMIYEHRGRDIHKRVNGRKRQIVVDTGGRLWLTCVHAAHLADGSAAVKLVCEIACLSERLKKVYGDQAYNGVFAQALWDWGIVFEKVTRPKSAPGFVPIAKHWVAERTIAWTNFFRRIVKDYEYTLSSSAAWLLLANIQLMLQRIPIADQT